MKVKIFSLAILLVAFVTGLQAQTTAKPVWKELKAFHGLMSASFHPAEDGNFEPLRQKADSLLIIARNWQASAIPADFKPEDTKAALSKLVAQCTVVKKAVDEKADNKVLFKEITEAHNIFHTIVGECRKAEEN